MSNDAKLNENKVPYAIVRGSDSGVVCGYAEHVDKSVVRVYKARQMYEWDSTFVLIDLATIGVRTVGSCRFSIPSGGPVLILDACAIIQCTEVAAQNLIDVPTEKHES